MGYILFLVASMIGTENGKSEDTHLQCGLHCLFVGMVALDVDCKLDDVESRLGPPQAGGYSLADLKRVAEAHGLKTTAVRTNAENLARRQERFACIAHVKGHHFVLITDVDLEKGLVSMLDPPRQIQQLPIATFNSQWAGDALLISPQDLESEESVAARAPWLTKSRQQTLAWGAIIGVGLLTLSVVLKRLFRKAPTEVAATAALFLLLSGCQQSAPLPVAEASPPSLLIVNPSIDFGEFVVSPSGHAASFEVQNRGGETLLLEEVHSGCGCALVKPVKKELAPGETRTIDVQLRAAHPEDRNTRITLKSNDPLFPMQSVELHWRVRAPIEFDPLRWEVGNVRPGQEVRMQVKLLKRDVANQKPGVISDFNSGQGETLAIEEIEPADDGSYELVTIRLVAGEDSGNHHAALTASVEGSDQKHLSLPVTWTVLPAYVPTPERVFLGLAKPGQELTGKVVISTDLESGLHVTGKSGLESLSGSAIELKEIDPKQTAVEFKFQAPEQEGIFRDEIELSIDEGTTLKVPVSGIVQAGA